MKELVAAKMTKDQLIQENDLLIMAIIKCWEFLSGSRRTSYVDTYDFLEEVLTKCGLRLDPEKEIDNAILDSQLVKDRMNVIESELLERLGPSLRGRHGGKARDRSHESVVLKEEVYRIIRNPQKSLRKIEGRSVRHILGSLVKIRDGKRKPYSETPDATTREALLRSLAVSGETSGGEDEGRVLDRRVRRALKYLEGEQRIERIKGTPLRWRVKKYAASMSSR